MPDYFDSGTSFAASRLIAANPHGAVIRRVDRVDLTRLGKAICAIHDRVVRLRLPPLEAGEEVHHVLVSSAHHHGIVAAPVDPAAAGIGPDVRVGDVLTTMDWVAAVWISWRCPKGGWALRWGTSRAKAFRQRR